MATGSTIVPPKSRARRPYRLKGFRWDPAQLEKLVQPSKTARCGVSATRVY
ncbi:hypothetical protein M2191_005659 [Bradyrhizobium japonicum]|nr:hypothetical protein [Bradyrhizobium japonicum]